MKLLIKRLLRENLLTEKLTDIDDDVNLIYEKYFEKDINEINRTNILTMKMFRYNESHTSVLKSNDCVNAHLKNPCSIVINDGKNYYNPSGEVIGVSVSINALDFLKSTGFNIQNATNHFDEQTLKSFKQEFSEEKIKGSIHHELVHWIDDTNNNRHILNRTKKAMELNTVNISGRQVNTTKMEIQAQIHNVKQLKNKYNDKWDKMSFSDMISLSPALWSINKSLNPVFKKEWIRNLKSRMYREKLLGNNMYND